MWYLFFILAILTNYCICTHAAYADVLLGKVVSIEKEDGYITVIPLDNVDKDDDQIPIKVKIDNGKISSIQPGRIIRIWGNEYLRDSLKKNNGEKIIPFSNFQVEINPKNSEFDKTGVRRRIKRRMDHFKSRRRPR